MKTDLLPFTRWPSDLSDEYRKQGFWQDIPLSSILKKQSLDNPERLAILCEGRHFTYKELDQLSDNLGENLIKSGLQTGDTALVQLPNIAEFLIVFFALIKAGIVPLNAIYKHRQHELDSFISQIKPKLLVVSSEHELFKDDKYLQHLQSIGLQSEIILKLNSPDHESNLTDWFNSRYTTGTQNSLLIPTPADQIALFQLSGGSTNTPKLIPRTHNDYLYNAEASAEVAKYSSETRFLCAMPIAHNFMLSSPGVLGVISRGGSIVMATSPEPLMCFDLIEKHQVNTTSLVPSSVIAWLSQMPTHEKKLKTLKLLHVGGAYFAEHIARQAIESFDCKLQQVFGMAEGLVNYTNLNDPVEIIVSTQGKPLSAGDEIKIIDENGKHVPNGQSGMLAVRGPYTFRGYFNSPEHNTAAFDLEGFYYSGDLVQLTPTGHLKVVGRVKDQINRAGEKIASEEIEELLIEHQDILDVAIISIPDSKYIEKSHAYIISPNKELNITDLRRFLLKKGVSDYKLPDSMSLVKHIPLTPIGKPDKKLLRQQENLRD